MITIQMLAGWFILSAVIFMGFTIPSWLEEAMDKNRSVNTVVVLLAQGLGALLLSCLI